jgi:hypothetical protein
MGDSIFDPLYNFMGRVLCYLPTRKQLHQLHQRRLTGYLVSLQPAGPKNEVAILSINRRDSYCARRCLYLNDPTKFIDVVVISVI